MDDDELSQHSVYHQHRPPSPSPAFDTMPIPDYLPLRRVKPLPKRKRSSPDPARSLPLNTLLPPILPPPPGPDATAEELIAHAEVLSAQITLQSYFLPTLNGGGATDATDFTRRRRNSGSSCSSSADGGGGVEVFRPPVVADVTPPAPCEGCEGGDHLDQSQQQGNAKKRKVPAHLSGSPMGPDSADLRSGVEGEEEQQPLLMLLGGERVVPPRLACSAEGVAGGGGGASPEEGAFNGGGTEAADGRQGKVLPATMVGLRQKQVLRHRRRQLATLLGSGLGSGSPSLGDSLALEQALLANNNNCALLNDNRSGVGRHVRLKSRLIRRRASRAAVRRHCTSAPPPPPSERTRRIFSDSEFTFLSSNAASERLIATRAECAVLCNRFEFELARQAEKVAESTKERESMATAGTNTVSGGGATATTTANRNERAVRKARATAQPVQPQDAADVPAVSKSSSSSTKTSGKKKKRSALANASNPHHLRNYVPSRIPNQVQLSAAQLGANAQNMLSPLPLLFLSAQIPPRRGTRPRPSAVESQLANPAEEWICPACEYRLFYGEDEQGYRMGVRNRKKILKRRRRARERAAAAANGSGTGVGVHGKGSGFDDEEDLDIETTESGLALGQTRLANVEREKGGGDRERLVELGAAG